MFMYTGRFFDEKRNVFIDRVGNHLHEDTVMDSLVFLISLTNLTWPCATPVVVTSAGMIPITRIQSDYPCHVPDISRLTESIILMNDTGIVAYPEEIWGRKNATLTQEEHIFVMFRFTDTQKAIIRQSRDISLTIIGIDEDTIRLIFPSDWFVQRSIL